MCELRDFDGILHTLKMTYIFIEICVTFANAGITTGLYIPIGLQIYRRFTKRSKRILKCKRRSLSVRKANSLMGERDNEYSEPTIINNAQCMMSKTSDSKCKLELNCILSRKDLNQQNVAKESEISSKTCNINLQDVKESAIGQNPPYHQERMNSSFENNKLSRDTLSDSNIQVRNNFTYMFLTIIIFYLLSYLPTFTIILLATDDPFRYWYSMDIITLNVIMLLRRSSIINHIVNPFIYGYFDRGFRKHFVESFICQIGFGHFMESFIPKLIFVVFEGNLIQNYLTR